MPSNTGSAKKKSSFSAEELDDDELNGMEDYKLVPVTRFTAAAPVEVLVPSRTFTYFFAFSS